MDENKCNLNDISNNIKGIIKNPSGNSISGKKKGKIVKISSTSSLPNVPTKKENKTISLDSVVYEIFGENKNKNYEKIINEIKKVEQKSEVEKSQLQKKISQMSKRLSNFQISNNIENDDEEIKNFEKLLNLQTKKLEMMEFEKDKKFNLVELLIKIKIPPEKRTIRDILRIKTYISQSRIGISYNEEFTDKDIAEKLIYFLCIEMRYKKYKKDEVIFRIGDPPDSFYSIIFGKVNILKPTPKIQYLTGNQYFLYLMNIRKQKEQYIYNLCIKNNKKNFVIEETYSELIHYIYLVNYLEYIKTTSDPEIDFDKILDLLDLTPEELGLEPDKITDNFYINDHIKSIKKRIPTISKGDIDKYSFINEHFFRREVIIYEYKKFLELNSNDYFGESAIETNTPRNATIIAEEETDMAYLPNKLYMAQIASEKSILLEKKISSLHSSYFFSKVKYHKFAKNYYNWFVYEKYIKNDTIFYEGENIKYFYFIQEGSIELTTSKSMNEIESLINILIDKKGNIVGKKLIDNERALNDSESIENQNDKNSFDYSKNNSEPDYDFLKYLKIKQQNKLIILNNNEDIGIVSFLLGAKYISTCTVISKFAKIYKIDVDYLNQMIQNEFDCREEFIRRMKNKLQLLRERIFKINNLKIIRTDAKINRINLKRKLELEKQILESNSSKIKTSINYDKLNHFLYHKNESNSSSGLNKSIDKNKNKIDVINLPLLNNNKNKNKFTLPYLNYKNESTKKSLKPIGLRLFKNNVLKMKYIKQTDVNSQKLDNIISQKYLIEDTMLSKIKKELKAFSENKLTLSKDKIKLINNRSSSSNSRSHICDSPNDNSELYLTQLPETIPNNINSYIDISTSLSPNDKEVKKNSNIFIPKIKNKGSSLSSEILKKMISNSLDKCITINNSLNSTNNYNSKDYYNNANTENNLKRLNDKNIDIIQKNSIKSIIKYNNAYCTPSTLLKKEKNRKFEDKNVFTDLKLNYYGSQNERIKELQSLRESFKNNYKFKLKSINKAENN